MSETVTDYRRWAYATAARFLTAAHKMSPAGGPGLDDVAQEGLVALWKSTKTFDPKLGAFPSYGTRAAERRMKELVFRERPQLGEGDRTRAHGSRGAQPDELQLDELEADLPAELRHELPDLDLGVDVRGAVRKLDPADRALVFRRYWLDEVVSDVERDRWRKRIRPTLAEALS